MLAVEAVVDIAFYGRSDPVQAKEISARQGVPHRYLEQVMQQLVHEGVLKGVRGPRGGYTLARERRRISVGDIVRVVSAVDATDEGDKAPPSALGATVVRPFWETTQNQLLASFDEITIEDMCREADAAGVPRDRASTSDFNI